MTLRGRGGLGLDVSIDHKSRHDHGLQLAISLRQNYFVWDNPKTSMNHLLRLQGRAAIKASKIIEALDCFLELYTTVTV